jgi:hypothetical protein
VVVHKAFNLPRRPGWVRTQCGTEAYPTGVTDEFDTALCNRVEAKLDGWDGVTCKRCMRKAPRLPRKRF